MSQLVVPQHHRRKLRPMAGRKNKEARERALLENRDVSVTKSMGTCIREHEYMYKRA